MKKKPVAPQTEVVDPQTEWEEMIARMTDEELTAWSRRQYEAEAVRERYMLDDEDGWEAMIAAMSHEELCAYFQAQNEAMLANPDLFPEISREDLEEAKALLEKYDKQNKECKILEQQARIAVARRDSLVEAYLTELSDNKTGH